ncbi:MAG: hypothetical protein DRI86_07435 [Bacteroidetes bacterium]|nr:MAG: hypothetical protein DRI86_07435 [Bacteroidota bacterium]
MKTLTDFKKYLANGGFIEVLSVYGEKPNEKIKGKRKVEKMQTANCKFEGGSWLEFPKASDFEIKGDKAIIYGKDWKTKKRVEVLTYLLIN